jgi:dihydrofolate reductase
MTHDVTSAASRGKTLALIAAVARNGVIGAGNTIPWRLPDDMRRFRALTTGHAIMMGRKTWESLAGPLPQRQNIVITRQAGWHADGAETAPSLAAAWPLVRLPPPVYCIGGGELYAAALPYADLLHLTEIDRDFAGDAHFPAYDRSAWREIARETHRAPEDFEYAFVEYERVVGHPAQRLPAPHHLR